MTVGFNDAGVVSPLPDRSRARTRAIDVGCMPACESLHHPDDAVRLPLGSQQVDVICHQDVGVEFAGMTARGVGQLDLESAIVSSFEEHRLPIVSAMDKVTRHIA